MMLDKMGTIGKTQGVNAKSKPKPKKLKAMPNRLPDCKVDCARDTSSTGKFALAFSSMAELSVPAAAELITEDGFTAAATAVVSAIGVIFPAVN
jgi:hypothetical protein